MDIKLYLENKKKIQNAIHEFVTNDESVIEEKYQNLVNLIENHITIENKEIKTVLRIIAKIANNHYRNNDFFPRIEKIILIFGEKIKQTLSNSEIFEIFKKNKRILLFLIEKNMISYDQSINNQFNYQNYFDSNQTEELKQKQHIGENDSQLCYLIRNDLIEQFIIYVNQNLISLSSFVIPSLFETHSFLIKKNPTLIEYSAFFGSSQIFKYLLLNKSKLTPSLWIYAIHGKDQEIIELLKQNYLSQGIQINFDQLFAESIKCHHYDLSKYLLQNFEHNNLSDIKSSIKYYNFLFFPDEFKNETYFYYLCKYDHYQLVELFLKNFKIDVNQKIVLFFNIFIKFHKKKQFMMFLIIVNF